MSTTNSETLILGVQAASALTVVFLICLQVFKLRRDYPILHYLTTGVIALTISGIAFGKYYAGKAPQRLKPLESAQPLVAVTGYTQAILLNPGNSDLYFRRGRTDFHLKQYSQAIVDFNRALDISPGNPEYLASRGVAYLFLRQYDLAENDISQALQKGFHDPEISMAKGVLAESGGRFREAVKYSTEALSATDLIRGNRCGALLNRGVSYLGLKQYPEAREDFTQAIDTCDDGDLENALVDRGNANLLMNNIDAALSDWEAALKLEPNDPVVFKNRERAYIDLGRSDLALMDLNRYLELRPNDAYTYLVRSNLYRLLGKIEAADRDQKTADDLSRSNRAQMYPEFQHLAPPN